ncbi:DUF2178 domain-containing protein [Janibacter cremeus]|uniref:Putative membrane protein n=1 Tax=Janibacter cremeus TaxID=1285192 RepID=A0A852VQF8_9MICO|nr:DUF2178 domain-containing protein [Janibacter cremeus]NYF98149.1 putative membrane protein [Janibacter cremeus]
MTNQARERGASGIAGVLTLCVVMGLVYLTIGVATDQTRFGIIGLLIMLAYGAVLFVGRRRLEALALLGGAFTDERRHDIGQRALAFTANVLVIGILGGFFVSLATRSEYTEVFAGLGALGGVAFIVGIVWNSVRG